MFSTFIKTAFLELLLTEKLMFVSVVPRVPFLILKIQGLKTLFLSKCPNADAIVIKCLIDLSVNVISFFLCLRYNMGVPDVILICDRYTMYSQTSDHSAAQELPNKNNKPCMDSP